MGPFETIWDHLGAFGTIWEHLGAFGSIWDNLVGDSFLSKALFMEHAAQCRAHASASILLAGWVHRRNLFLVSILISRTFNLFFV